MLFGTRECRKVSFWDQAQLKNTHTHTHTHTHIYTYIYVYTSGGNAKNTMFFEIEKHKSLQVQLHAVP